MAVIYFTVTNDLTYDQRMIRICTALSGAGYEVRLVGRSTPSSVPLIKRPFKQQRIKCFFTSGKLFYAEFNLRLFFFLIFKKMDGLCAVDLDTILPCYYVSKLRNVKPIYDAHELFCEMKEVVSRPSVYKFWKKIESKTIPYFKDGYTVNKPIAEEFLRMYGVTYEVIRNIPRFEPFEKREPGEYLLYQGAVNEGRAFETLIPAMKFIDKPLWIAGNGNFMNQAQQLVKDHQLEHKVRFLGMIEPQELKEITRNAFAGFTLFDGIGSSNYYSLANRFFDYMHAGIPQVCVNFPVYAEINKIHRFAVVIDDVKTESIINATNSLITNKELYAQLQYNAREAAQALNWQNEQLKLVAFYRKIFG